KLSWCNSDQVPVQVQIPEDPLTHRGRWNNAFGALLLALARSFVVGEEKQTVFAKRPAHRSAKNVAVQLEWFIRSADVELGLLHQVVISAGDGIAQVFISRAMEGICPALGHQGDLRSRALPLIGAVVGGGHTKFLNGIL